jgi:rubrerythrin
MGRKLGWQCTKCEKGEVFHLGYGAKALNPPVFIEEARSGVHGSLLKTLFSDNAPVKVDVRMRGAHFRCPYCQHIYSGKVAYVSDDTGAIFRHTIAPERCPHCNSVVDNEASGVRVRSKGIQRYVDGIWEHGCPSCGAEVERLDAPWE